MKVLYIGGTGNISTPVSRMTVEKGIDLILLNRGNRQVVIPGTRTLKGDIHKPGEIAALLKDECFDVVVNWIAFSPGDIRRDFELFRDKTKQYIFISSASAYQKPPLHPVITESTPLCNPFWEYSRNKILCEELLINYYRETGFPVTIVRPSHTYDSILPIAVGEGGGFTLADRLLKGQKIIIHGDGTSLWTLTHAEDFSRAFCGLLGHQQAIGHSFHITSDEVLTWNQIYATIAAGLGVEAHIVHIPTDFIVHLKPEMQGGLRGDKSHCAVFDNSKIKTFVPDFKAVIPFSEGIRRTIAWFNAREERRYVNHRVNKDMDEIITAYGQMFK